MIIIKAVAFVVVTSGLAYVSRASILAPRSHGFYRFLAWEAIVVLILLNIESWFRSPFSWNQVISWCLLTASLFLVVHAVYMLRVMGKPDGQRDDPSLVGLEKTTMLVNSGAYRYVRHPMYSSLLFLAWGVFFKRPSWLGGLLAVTSTLLLVATARIEEAEDILFFGPDYEAYRKQTKMFIPFVF